LDFPEVASYELLDSNKIVRDLERQIANLEQEIEKDK